MTNSISISDLTKTYQTKEGVVTAVDQLSLEIPAGSFTALQGISGSGKSTLLYLLSGLIKPSSGSVKLHGTSLYDLSESNRTSLRAKSIGMVFQNFHLLPYLNVLENITVTAFNKVATSDETEAKARELLEKLELTHRISHHPAKLSAGECQRVAIARAIITNPTILLADEPTGNLDNENTDIVLNHLKSYSKAGNTVVMVTHSDHDANTADQIIKLNNGKLV